MRKKIQGREALVGYKENNPLDMFSKEENYLLIGDKGQMSQITRDRREKKIMSVTLEPRSSKGQISEIFF